MFFKSHEDADGSADAEEEKGRATGRVYIKGTSHNAIVSITDAAGHAITQASAGTDGFTGAHKATPPAAGTAARSAAQRAMQHGVRRVDIFVKGSGPGREAAIRAVQAAGMDIGSVQEISSPPERQHS